MKKVLGFLLMCLVSLVAKADENAVTLMQMLQQTHSMQADFTQTMIDKSKGENKIIQRSTGKMALKRPGKFRWQVTQPSPQLMITDGKHLWIYDPDLEQVIVRLLTKEIGDSPAMLLSDPNQALATDYTVLALPGTPTWFMLTPKNEKSLFAMIKLGFVQNQIREMVLLDRLGHETAIQFSNIKVNPHLAAKLFYFNPPLGVDVIDETKR